MWCRRVVVCDSVGLVLRVFVLDVVGLIVFGLLVSDCWGRGGVYHGVV